LVSARFFVDENDLVLGKELAGKRGDIVSRPLLVA